MVGVPCGSNFRVLSRYLGFEHEVKVNFCSECSTLVGLISELFQNYELIQMQLNMRLKILCDIVKKAFVSERNYKEKLGKGQRESAESFRDEIVHKCLVKTGRRGPFMCIRKLDDSRRSAISQFSSHPQDNLLMLSYLGCVISFWLVISLSFIDPEELIRKQRSSNEENVCFLPLPCHSIELERPNAPTSPATPTKDEVQFDKDGSLSPKIIHVESLSQSQSNEIEAPSNRTDCENDTSNQNQLPPTPTKDDTGGEVEEPAQNGEQNQLPLTPTSTMDTASISVGEVGERENGEDGVPLPEKENDDPPLISAGEVEEPENGEEGVSLEKENDTPSIKNRKTFLVKEVVDDIATKYFIQITKKRKKSIEGLTSQSETSESLGVITSPKRKRSPELSQFSKKGNEKDVSLPLVPSISDLDTDSETESDTGMEDSTPSSLELNWDSDASTDVDSHVSLPSYGAITDLTPSKLSELLRQKCSEREEMEIEPESPVSPSPEFVEGLDLQSEEIETPAPEGPQNEVPLVMEMVPPKPVFTTYCAYLICETCHLQFDSRAKLEKHRVVIHNCKKYVKCPLCSKMFDSYQSLELHRKNRKGCEVSEHTKQLEMEDMSRPIFPWCDIKHNLIFCPYEHCFEIFPSKNLLQIHLRVHGEFVCSFCPQKFQKANHLAMHEFKEHLKKGKNMKKCIKNFACARCQFSSQMDHEYIEHFVKTHLNISSSSEELEKDNQPPNKDNHLQSKQSCAFRIMKY